MQAVIFDLDNTLYDISQYNYGAFRDISQYISSKHSLSEDQLYHKLIEIWHIRTSMYPKLFDDFLDELNLIDELAEVITIFNNHNRPLHPFSDVIPTLEKIKKMKYKLGLITDGNHQRQKRKLQSLGILNFFDAIIFTSEIGFPKPSIIPYTTILQKLKLKGENVLYIGDNPHLDFEGAKKTGMKTIRILRGEFIQVPKNSYIDLEIGKMNGLLNIISRDR